MVILSEMMFQKTRSNGTKPLTWTTPLVTNFSSMFSGTGFSQDISTFNFSNATNITDFLNTDKFSVINFTNLLQSLSTQTLNSGLAFGNNSVKLRHINDSYKIAVEARDGLYHQRPYVI